MTVRRSFYCKQLTQWSEEEAAVRRHLVKTALESCRPCAFLYHSPRSVGLGLSSDDQRDSAAESQCCPNREQPAAKPAACFTEKSNNVGTEIPAQIRHRVDDRNR